MKIHSVQSVHMSQGHYMRTNLENSSGYLPTLFCINFLLIGEYYSGGEISQHLT